MTLSMKKVNTVFLISPCHPSTVFNKRLDHVYRQRKCAVKVNFSFRIVLKNIANGTCRYFHAHENYTVMEMLKLLSIQNAMVHLEKIAEISYSRLLHKRKSEH